MVRTALLTVLEGDPAALQEDLAAQALRQVLVTGPFVEVDYQVVPDEQAMIRAKLRVWADAGSVDLVLTTGGIGLGLKGRTPEATEEVIERVVPGLAEAMRRQLVATQPLALLWRGVAGVRRNTLIVNLPSQADEARQALKTVVDVLPSAVRRLGNGAALSAN
jgi:molybdenum cofactor synthesis domain-containing protein